VIRFVAFYGRMARGGHGLPKLSLKPARPYPSTPCERATPETALQPFEEWPTHRVGSLWPSSTSLDTPRHTSMVLLLSDSYNEAKDETRSEEDSLCGRWALKNNKDHLVLFGYEDNANFK
jgi:hypothetical protein